MKEPEKQPEKPFTASLADQRTTPENCIRNWQIIIGRCDALNAIEGTHKVSKDIIARRKRRAKARAEGEHALEPLERNVFDHQQHIADIENQSVLPFMLGSHGHETLLDALEARMNGEPPLDAPAARTDTQGLRRHLMRHLLVTAPVLAGR